MRTMTRMQVMTSIMPNSISIPDRMSFRTALALCLTTAALLWGSFFPLNAGFLAWFAFVPMLLLVRAPIALWKAAAATFIGGYAFNIVTMEWIRIADPRMYASWIALSFYCSLFFPVALWLLRRLDRMQLPFTLTFPLVWVPLEYFKSHFLTGFAWYLLGHSQHDYLPMIQITDLTGVYGISFLIASANGLIAELCLFAFRARLALPATVRPSRLVLQATIVAAVVAATVGYGYFRLHQGNFAEGPKVALLQSNLDQRMKNARMLGNQEGLDAISFMHKTMYDLTAEARSKHSGVDLMVWPETMCPHEWRCLEPTVGSCPTAWQEMIQDRCDMVREIALFSRTNVLLGINTIEWTNSERDNRYNSALLVRKDGMPIGRYDKIHCVPFGEYVPMRKTMPFMSVFVPYDYDYSLTEGNKRTRFVLPTPRGDFTFGAIICYEDSDPLLARKYVQDEGEGAPPVDFLVNMSNDGWFNGHPEHEQHLAICRFRALECRRSVVRAVNMGISAVIDPNGRVVALPADSWGESKKKPAVVVANIPIDCRASLYAKVGDWFPATLSVLAGLALGTTLLRRNATTV